MGSADQQFFYSGSVSGLVQPAQESIVPEQEERVLPHPQLTQLHNLTGLRHFQFMDMGPGRKFYDVVILKATFDLADGVAQLSDQQSAPCLVDEYWNEEAPEFSSLRLAGDTVLYKPFTDVYVTGTVRSYQNQPQTEWHGLLRVRRGQEILINKTLLFCGPRQWNHQNKNVWQLNQPQPTTEVALRYELAWGGHHVDPELLKKQKIDKTTGPTEEQIEEATQIFQANPTGSGYFGALMDQAIMQPAHDITQHYDGPQISWADEVLSKSTDVHPKSYKAPGWGPIARWWSPRVERQGTYDDAWMQDFNNHKFSDYPKDFNHGYFNCAPADQMIPNALQGDEWIEMAGVFADRPTLRMQLPAWKIMAHSFNQDNEEQQPQVRLDTLHIDLDAKKMYATWRLTLDHGWGVGTALIGKQQS
jgi:hypothetical protein